MKKNVLRSVPALLTTELPPPSQLLAKVLPACPSCSAQDRPLLFPDWRLWLALPVLMLAIVSLMFITGMGVDAGGQAWQHLQAVLLLLGMGLGAAYLGYMRLSLFFQVLAFFIIFNKLGLMLNYLLMGLQTPFADAQLAQLDALLGFDWTAHVAWVNDHPLVIRILEEAYGSYPWFFLLVFSWLVITCHFRRLQGFILLYASTGLIAMLIGAWLLPALGGYGHHAPAADIISNLPASAGRYALEHARLLNAGLMPNVPLDVSVGLVTFPSFHTVMALLFIWALRGTIWFWPSLVINTLTIISTPSMGGHYLVDVIAGGVLFLIVWAVLRHFRLLGDDERPQPFPWAEELARRWRRA